MVFDWEELDCGGALRHERLEYLFRGRAGDHRNAEAVELRPQGGLRQGQQAPTGEERSQAEVHLLLAPEGIGSGATLEVDGAVKQRGNAVLNGDRYPRDLEVRDLALEVGHDMHAQ